MTEPVATSPAPSELRADIDAVLFAFLEDERAKFAEAHPAAETVADELTRLVRSGGKRLRPALGYWGYRAAGGIADTRIIRAVASMELFHMFALIHDDLMDDAERRRGVASVHAALAGGLGSEAVGRSAAILVGDLAAVWADSMLVSSGFEDMRVVRALTRAYAIRRDMALGQFLDISGSARLDPQTGRLAANLKGGRYTVTGPLLMGAELAHDEPVDGDLEQLLANFGDPLGEAFQIRDDLEDGDAAHGAGAATAETLITEALGALDALVRAEIDADVAEALSAIAAAVAG